MPLAAAEPQRKSFAELGQNQERPRILTAPLTYSKVGLRALPFTLNGPAGPARRARRITTTNAGSCLPGRPRCCVNAVWVRSARSILALNFCPEPVQRWVFIGAVLHEGQHSLTCRGSATLRCAPMADPQSLLGQAVSHYRSWKKLTGRGGDEVVVYKARTQGSGRVRGP